jgi:hypothetical protein
VGVIGGAWEKPLAATNTDITAREKGIWNVLDMSFFKRHLSI